MKRFYRHIIIIIYSYLNIIKWASCRKNININNEKNQKEFTIFCLSRQFLFYFHTSLNCFWVLLVYIQYTHNITDEAHEMRIVLSINFTGLFSWPNEWRRTGKTGKVIRIGLYEKRQSLYLYCYIQPYSNSVMHNAMIV